MRRRLCAALVAAAATIVLLPACAPDVLVIMDPILSATADAEGALTRELQRAGRRRNRRVAVVAMQDLSVTAFIHALETHLAPLVLAPGLVGTIAIEAAVDYPQRRFYLVGREVEPDGHNVAAVTFDRIAAFGAAGQAAAQRLTELSAAGRAVPLTLLFLVDSPQRAAELAAFRHAVEQKLAEPGTFEAVPPARVQQYNDPPDADTLRLVLRADDRSETAGNNRGGLYAFFLASANTVAWEVVGNRPATIISEWLPPQTGDRRVLGWIDHSWADALQAVLESGDAGFLRVPARYVHGPASNYEAVNTMAPAADVGR